MAYTVADPGTRNRPRRSWARHLATALIALLIVGAVGTGIGITVHIQRVHDHWWTVVCAEAGTAPAQQIIDDASHGSHDLQQDAYPYARDLDTYGPNALVTQKAFDSLQRSCAS